MVLDERQSGCKIIKQKMQLDVDIEPTLRFPHMTSIDKQMDTIVAVHNVP